MDISPGFTAVSSLARSNLLQVHLGRPNQLLLPGGQMRTGTLLIRRQQVLARCQCLPPHGGILRGKGEAMIWLAGR